MTGKKITFDEAVSQILARDPRYASDAYRFVRESLDFTLRSLRRSARSRSPSADQHVTGAELLQGIRQFALEEYGPMAHSVFEFWGIQCCRDFGEIVFNLVEAGVFGKTERDSIEDFADGFDFEEAFIKPFLPERDANPRGRTRLRRGLPAKSNPRPASKTPASEPHDA